MEYEPQITVHQTDDPGTAGDDFGEQFNDRRPLLLDGLGHLYVGGLGQTHDEAMESHGLAHNEGLSRGLYLPHGNEDWGRAPGHVGWFDKTIKPEWQAAAGRALNSTSQPADIYDFESPVEGPGVRSKVIRGINLGPYTAEDTQGLRTPQIEIHTVPKTWARDKADPERATVGDPGVAAIYHSPSQTLYIGPNDLHHPDVHTYIDHVTGETRPGVFDPGVGRHEGELYDDSGQMEWYSPPSYPEATAIEKALNMKQRDPNLFDFERFAADFESKTAAPYKPFVVTPSYGLQVGPTGGYHAGLQGNGDPGVVRGLIHPGNEYELWHDDPNHWAHAELRGAGYRPQSQGFDFMSKTARPQPAPTPEELAQGRSCYFHPDRPAVAATAFAAMCPDCLHRYQLAQESVTKRQANDDMREMPEWEGWMSADDRAKARRDDDGRGRGSEDLWETPTADPGDGTRGHGEGKPDHGAQPVDSNSPAELDWEDEGGRVAATAPGFTPWTPESGMHGKFIITPENEVHHWATGYGPDDDPGHGEYVESTGRAPEYYHDSEEDIGKWTPGWIEPDGRTETLKGHKHRLPLLYEAAPGTYGHDGLFDFTAADISPRDTGFNMHQDPMSGPAAPSSFGQACPQCGNLISRDNTCHRCGYDWSQTEHGVQFSNDTAYLAAATPIQVIDHGRSPEEEFGGGYDGRRPIIYQRGQPHVHVGDERETHFDLMTRAGVEYPDDEHNLHQGWLGYNPEGSPDDPTTNMSTPNEYGWYGERPGDHVDQALAQHFNAHPPDHKDEDGYPIERYDFEHFSGWPNPDDWDFDRYDPEEPWQGRPVIETHDGRILVGQRDTYHHDLMQQHGISDSDCAHIMETTPDGGLEYEGGSPKQGPGMPTSWTWDEANAARARAEHYINTVVEASHHEQEAKEARGEEADQHVGSHQPADGLLHTGDGAKREGDPQGSRPGHQGGQAHQERGQLDVRSTQKVRRADGLLDRGHHARDGHDTARSSASDDRRLSQRLTWVTQSDNGKPVGPDQSVWWHPDYGAYTGPSHMHHAQLATYLPDVAKHDSWTSAVRNGWHQAYTSMNGKLEAGTNKTNPFLQQISDDTGAPVAGNNMRYDFEARTANEPKDVGRVLGSETFIEHNGTRYWGTPTEQYHAQVAKRHGLTPEILADSHFGGIEGGRIEYYTHPEGGGIYRDPTQQHMNNERDIWNQYNPQFDFDQYTSSARRAARSEVEHEGDGPVSPIVASTQHNTTAPANLPHQLDTLRAPQSPMNTSKTYSPLSPSPASAHSGAHEQGTASPLVALSSFLRARAIKEDEPHHHARSRAEDGRELAPGTWMGGGTAAQASTTHAQAGALAHNRPSCKEFLSRSSIREQADFLDAEFQGSLYDKASGSHTVVGASPGGAPDWVPGTYGKGLLHSDGTVTHWQVNDYGEPHHVEVMSKLMHEHPLGREVLNSGTFVIEPDASTNISADYWPKALSEHGFSPQGAYDFEGYGSHKDASRTSEVVHVPGGITDPTHAPYQAMIHVPTLGKTFIGSHGVSHANLIKQVPELQPFYTLGTHRNLSYSGNRHGSIENGREYWFDEPTYDFESRTSGSVVPTVTKTDDWPYDVTVAPWAPGHQGKGFVHPDGTVYTWRSGQPSDPHHYEIDPVKYENGAQGDQTPGERMFQINPYGEVEDSIWSRGKDTSAIHQQIMAQDPRLKVVPETYDFEDPYDSRPGFLKGGSRMSGYLTPPGEEFRPFDPALPGKAMVHGPTGQIYAWSSPEGMLEGPDPHHSDAQMALEHTHPDLKRDANDSLAPRPWGDYWYDPQAGIEAFGLHAQKHLPTVTKALTVPQADPDQFDFGQYSKVAELVPGSQQDAWPEVPDPNEHWQALRTPAGWHVWPDDDAHAVYMKKNGIPFEHALDFAHYAPPHHFSPGWHSYLHMKQDYSDIYHTLDEEGNYAPSPDQYDFEHFESKTKQPTNSRIVFASDYEMEDWEPGFPGKAVVFKDGDVWPWKTDETGSPHHWDIAMPSHNRGNPVRSYHDIRPDGTVMPEQMGHRDADVVAKYIGGQPEYGFDFEETDPFSPKGASRVAVIGEDKLGPGMGGGGRDLRRVYPAKPDPLPLDQAMDMLNRNKIPREDLRANLPYGPDNEWSYNEGLSSVEHWRPGVPGKGILIDNEPHTWAIDKFESPHHPDMHNIIDPSEESTVGGYYHIDPQGGVTAQGHGQSRIEEFVAHDPRLHTGWEGYDFESKTAAGMAMDLFTCSNCGSHAMAEPTQLSPGNWTQLCTRCKRSRRVDPTHPMIKSLMNQTGYPQMMQDINGQRPMNYFGSRGQGSHADEPGHDGANKAHPRNDVPVLAEHLHAKEEAQQGSDKEDEGQHLKKTNDGGDKDAEHEADKEAKEANEFLVSHLAQHQEEAAHEEEERGPAHHNRRTISDVLGITDEKADDQVVGDQHHGRKSGAGVEADLSHIRRIADIDWEHNERPYIPEMDDDPQSVAHVIVPEGFDHAQAKQQRVPFWALEHPQRENTYAVLLGHPGMEHAGIHDMHDPGFQQWPLAYSGGIWPGGSGKIGPGGNRLFDNDTIEFYNSFLRDPLGPVSEYDDPQHFYDQEHFEKHPEEVTPEFLEMERRVQDSYKKQRDVQNAVESGIMRHMQGNPYNFVKGDALAPDEYDFERYSGVLDDDGWDDDWAHELTDASQLVPWKKGTNGKGILHTDGSLTTWQDPKIHHADVARFVAKPTKQFLDSIDPNGMVLINQDEPDEQVWNHLRSKGFDPRTVHDYDWDFGVPEDDYVGLNG